ncbi:hypothetical protein E2R60_04200 [Paenibacillus dendritiformis]|uniref:CdiA C-terminal domain-containing protein n=1 Tax=Paenibacillus dendritiformis TaxID=130049 RepID=UPI001059C6CE|nr:contractile injection system protein, VgrG/Pvc8 family [Paenibacillus dendritiformis]TDL57701.1 hypothetical protein E2R60_04200 [Paenibacillus dendritiformis]
MGENQTIEAWGYESIVLGGVQGTVHLQELRMHQKINEHATADITLVMDEDKIETYLATALCNRKVVLRHRTEKHKILFNGVIRGSEAEWADGIYIVRIQAISHTYNMDSERRRSSFQNQQITYSELLGQVVEGYAHSDFIWPDARSHQPVKRFILQYDETDWEFVRRVVSHVNLGLIPEIRLDGAKYYVGLPEGRKEIMLPKAPYQVSRQLAKVQKIVSNRTISDMDESDSLRYKLKNRYASYELGDPVRFQGKSLVIEEKSSHLSPQDGILRHDYTLVTVKGSQQEKRSNAKLAGTSIAGTVIDVKSHYTKLHLHIDEKQDKPTATWFPQPTYFTGGEGKGYGTMPEMGEVLHLHFPVSDEAEHYIISSEGSDYEAIAQRIQSSTLNPEPPKPKPSVEGTVPPRTRNPGQPLTEDTIYRSKQWFTPGNQSLLLDDHQVKLHAAGGASQITLLEGSGILVNSAGSMDLSAKNVQINPDMVGAEETIPSEGVNVTLCADDTIVLLCEGSSIMMRGKNQEVHMRADNVRLESPENPLDLQVMAADAVRERLEAYEQAKLNHLPIFSPDGTLITGLNMDEQLLFDYYMKYIHKPNPYGTPPLTMFDGWRKQTYGKNKMEQFWEYVGASGKYVLDSKNAEPNAGGVTGSILLGFTGADLPLDLRDIALDFWNWKWSWSHAGETLLDLAAIVPVVGVLKNGKKLNSIEELATEVRKAGGFKHYNTAGQLVTVKKLSNGTFEIVDESGKVIKRLDNFPGVANELGIKIGRGKSGAEAAKAGINGVNMKTEPSLPKGSKPKGNYAQGKDRGWIKQNESADLFAKEGYDIKMLDEINGGNGYGIKEGSNPDFLIEGNVFDHYAPVSTKSANGIAEEIKRKTKSQAERIVLNLDDFTDDQIAEVVRKILGKSNPNGDLRRLQELFIVRDGEIKLLYWRE